MDERAGLDNTLARAEMLLELRRPEAAEHVLRSILLDDPGDGLALRLLAQALGDQKRHVEAVVAARAGVAADPSDAAALVCLAWACRQSGDAAQAIAAAQEAVLLAPRSWESHLALAAAWQAPGRRGSSRRGLTAAREAIRLAPAEPAPHVLAGMCLDDMGRFRAARRENLEALHLDPANVDAVNNEAARQIEAGRLRKAGNALTSGLGLDPTYATLHQNYDGLLTVLLRRTGVAYVLVSAVLGGLVLGKADHGTRAVISLGTLLLIGAGLRRVVRALPGGFPTLVQGQPRLHVAVVAVLLTVASTVVAWLGLAPLSAAQPLAELCIGVVQRAGGLLLLILLPLTVRRFVRRL